MLYTLCCLLLTGGAVLADQDDPRLDDLFGRLAVATDAREARQIGLVIRDVWRIYDGESYDVVEFLNRGGRAAARGEDNLAELAFGGVIDKAPDFVEGWHQRGTLRLRRGDFGGAIADLTVALSLEPRHFDALTALGHCHLALDRPAQALVAYEAALRIHPYLPAALQRATELRGPPGDRI